VDVVVAAKRMRVFLLVVIAFNLNDRVEELVLASAKVGYFAERFEGSVRLDVHCHGELADGDGPDVQVVHVHDVHVSLRVERPDVGLERFDVEAGGNTLHDNVDALAEHGDSREHHNHGEEVRADGVAEPQVGEEVNDCGSNNHADRHKHVAQHVQKGRVDVDIATFFLLYAVS
jgi:hypothetical protein